MNFLITLYIFSAAFALMVLVAWICERRERGRARCKIRAMRKGERRKRADFMRALFSRARRTCI